MMDMTMRKSLSRFRAKATLDTSFFLKPNKTILVDEALWTFAEIIAAGTAQGMRDAHVGPKVWICWILGTLTAEGFAERSIDKNGNCVFKSTPELVEDDRHRSVNTTAGTSFQTANFNIFSNPEKTFGIST